ncbi:hypothetical protein H839_09243 [Parageobacillus genomosp. 1]|uniref:Uncharacterized protein n=1 Tax=Parageobacillus genomosp. 1 TaxID=1295642 RepID=A0ABC9VE80_9BACL|nr:hypothetical protein H839_09243 [Parageobacillus genomosp. 1]
MKNQQQTSLRFEARFFWSAVLQNGGGFPVWIIIGLLLQKCKNTLKVYISVVIIIVKTGGM